jgi:hypothetical protein
VAVALDGTLVAVVVAQAALMAAAWIDTQVTGVTLDTPADPGVRIDYRLPDAIPVTSVAQVHPDCACHDVVPSLPESA